MSLFGGDHPKPESRVLKRKEGWQQSCRTPKAPNRQEMHLANMIVEHRLWVEICARTCSGSLHCWHTSPRLMVGRELGAPVMMVA